MLSSISYVLAADQSYVLIDKWGSKCNTEPDGSCVPLEDGKFSGPTGLAIDQEGFVYVIDYYNHRVQKFTNNGEFVTSWGSYGTGDGKLNYANGIAVDQLGFVYVANNGNNRIEKFTDDGTFIKSWRINDSPFGVAVDQDGFVYVTGFNQGKIQKFTNNGEFVTSWGSKGTGDGEFTSILGIEVDQDGFVYVVDTDTNDHYADRDRIQKFTNNGEFVTSWGSKGTGEGEFNNPAEIAVDNKGFVYVTDFYNSRVQKFTNNGEFVTSWGSKGTGDGEFSNPWGIDVDLEGNVFVSDFINNNIQVFGLQNEPGPFSDAGPDQSVQSNDLVQLDGSNSSDPNGSPLTYSWTQVSGPPVALNDPTSSNPTFVAPETTEQIDIIFQLVVTNEENTVSEPDDVTITVSPIPVILKPLADAGPDQNVISKDIVQLDGSNSSDPNGSSLTYFWNQTLGPEVSLSEQSSSNPSFIAPEVNEQTDLTFQLTVTNEKGFTSEPDEVTITVKLISIPPPPEEQPRTIGDIMKGIIQNPLNVTNSIDSANEIRNILTDGNRDNDQIVCDLIDSEDEYTSNIRELLNC